MFWVSVLHVLGFSQSLEQFLRVDQNNHGNKIPFLLYSICGLKIVNFAETPECGDPEKPIYGIVKVHGEVAHYNCIPGYIRRGNSTRTCTWSGWRPVPVPECIGNYFNLFLTQFYAYCEC